MPSVIHIFLIKDIIRAWSELDASIIEPLLSDNLHYHSWWDMVEFFSKESFMEYINYRFKSYKEHGIRPLVKLGVNRNNGEHAVALQFGDDVPILIRIEEEDGKIKEMWMQSAE